MATPYYPILRNKSALALLLLLVFATFWYIYVFDEKLDLNGDNITYFLLGKALASGKGYTEIWTSQNLPHTQYPPGYPAIISFILLLLPLQDLSSAVAVKTVNGLFFLGVIILFFLFCKKCAINKWLFPLIFLPLITNPHLVLFANSMMSEMSFLFFTIAALYAVTRIDYSVKPYNEKMFYITVLCVLMSFYIRTQGLALFFGIIIYFLFNKKYLHILWSILLCGLLLLPWIIYIQLNGGSSYVHQLLMVNPYNQDADTMTFIQLLKRMAINIKRYVVVEIPIACFPILETKAVIIRKAGWLIGLAIIALSVNGIRRIKSYRMLILGYLIGTFGVLLLWPSVWFGVRFMIGIIPLIWLLAVVGIFSPIITVFEKKALDYKVLFILFSAVFLVNLPSLEFMHKNAQAPYPQNWQNYFKIAEWVRKNTSLKTVISCRKPNFFYLFSHRPTCAYLFSEDNVKLVLNLIEQGVNYVVVDQLGYSSTISYLVPAINQNPEFFQEVLKVNNPDTYLFKVQSADNKSDEGKIAGVSLQVMALHQLKMNNYDQAERLLNKSLETMEKRTGINNTVYANSLNNLGIIAFMRNDFSGAQKFFERSLTIEQGMLGRDHPEIAMSLINIAEMYRAQGYYSTADTLYKRALSIREKIYGTENEYIAEMQLILIKFYTAWGKQELADAAFNRIVSIMNVVEKKNRAKCLPFLTDLQEFYKKADTKDKVEILQILINGIKADS